MIGLPQPSLSFKLPSLHDEKLLQCRIYHPTQLAAPRLSKRGAIIAHPYALLGGCYDDPVVGIVSNEALKNGWIVMTFNFRGAGDSQGRTSWTGNAECTDYASVAGFFIQYLALLELQSGEPSIFSTDGAQSKSPIDMVLGGYSYGSMIAANCPPVPSILAPFGGSSEPSKAAAHITSRAQGLAAETNQELRDARHARLNVPSAVSEPTRKSIDHIVSVGGDEATSNNQHENQEHGSGICDIRQSLDAVTRKLHLRKSTEVARITEASQDEQAEPQLLSKFDFPINTHYLLVSPLLPPIASLIALPFSSPRNHNENVTKLATNSTLAIYGENDGFTSSKKLNAWGNGLAKSNPRFHAIEVDCAGHFWREPGVAQELVEHVRDWITTLTECDPKL